MRRTSAAVYLRFLVVFTLLGGVGVAAVGYTLVNQRVSLPFEDTYVVRATFSATEGLTGGLGQPVEVVGVKVGQVLAVEADRGRSIVSMEIERGKLPRVGRDARASLEPITPLRDMRITLMPGDGSAPPLGEDDVIPLSATKVPVPFSEILARLDADTREFVAALLAAADRGSAGRADDFRAAVRTFGPTAGQVRRIGRSVASRRRELARLVRNFGRLTRAATQDERLGAAVVAGHRTLRAIAAEDVALGAAVERLPRTLRTARAALTAVRPFTRDLAGTLEDLTPALGRLPGTLRSLAPFADRATRTLRTDVNPMVREAVPVTARLHPITVELERTTPALAHAFQALTYATNTFAYNPPGDDEGGLFWLAWFFHNWNSITSSGDAHGGIGRGMIIADCQGMQGIAELRPLFAGLGICPT